MILFTSQHLTVGPCHWPGYKEDLSSLGEQRGCSLHGCSRSTVISNTEDLLPHPYKCNPAVCQMKEGKENATQMEFSVFAKIKHEHNLTL